MKIAPANPFSFEAKPRPVENTITPQRPLRTVERGDRIERKPPFATKDTPGADILFSRIHDAVWDAFYLRRADGFEHGIGSKRPDQMAFIIKRDLDSALASSGIRIHAHRDRANCENYRVEGRDDSGNGFDITISREDLVHAEPIELGYPARSLITDWRWKFERHDTGYLETHKAGFPTNSWIPEPKPNAMTGKGDAG